MKDLIILLIALWIASAAICFHVWQEIELPHNLLSQDQIVNTEPNWVATKRIVGNTYKTSISLEPNLSPSDAIKIAQYFVKQRCKTAKIKRITILYTAKTNMWVIWEKIQVDGAEDGLD